MSDATLQLTTNEREYLVDLLQRSLEKTLVEEHRTRAPDYRQHIVEREHTIKSLLSKLGHAAS